MCSPHARKSTTPRPNESIIHTEKTKQQKLQYHNQANANEPDVYDFQMLQYMRDLVSVELSEDIIELFFNNIRKLQMIATRERNQSKIEDSSRLSVSDLAALSLQSIYYQNIQSIPAKQDIKVRIASSQYKIMCFTETWLNDSHRDEMFFPSNFDIYRHDRQTRGGGVAVLLDKMFKSKEISCDRAQLCNCVCVEIPFKHKPVIIYVGYVPQWQQKDDNTYNQHFENIKNIATSHLNH